MQASADDAVIFRQQHEEPVLNELGQVLHTESLLTCRLIDPLYRGVGSRVNLHDK